MRVKANNLRVSVYTLHCTYPLPDNTDISVYYSTDGHIIKVSDHIIVLHPELSIILI